jgi:hypothetical protein
MLHFTLSFFSINSFIIFTCAFCAFFSFSYFEDFLYNNRWSFFIYNIFRYLKYYAYVKEGGDQILVAPDLLVRERCQ